jgi:hypothetical protein
LRVTAGNVKIHPESVVAVELFMLEPVPKVLEEFLQDRGGYGYCENSPLGVGRGVGQN